MNVAIKPQINIDIMEKEFKVIYKRIGNNIRSKRKELSLTQETLAMKVIPKLDRSKISDMENGKEDFTFSTLLRICAALNVNVEDIVK